MKKYPKCFPDNFETEILPEDAKEENKSVYRIIKSGIIDRDSFISTYEEMERGLIPRKKKLDLFQKICESVTIPVVAIGGINADNVLRLKGRKMAGTAVVSGIFACEDIEKGTRELLEKVESII